MAATLQMLVGLTGLVVGAEFLVRSGSALATRLGVAPITIGLTVVAIGTSVPELAVGIDAAARDNAGLAIGNIVGTNLVNLLLILGLSAVIAPIVLTSRTVRFDAPIMTCAALLVVALGLDGALTTGEGWLLLAAAVGYTYAILRLARRERPAPTGPPRDERGSVTLMGLTLVLGLAIIVLGADLLVRGAVSAAEALGVSDVVIGLTVVAIGTSAPELVTTILATFRGDRDLALGNLLGSSVYNLVLILGATVVFAPGDVPVPEAIRVDLLVMAAVAVACIPVFVSGRRIQRLEGAAFVLAYGVYLAWILTTRT